MSIKRNFSSTICLPSGTVHTEKADKFLTLSFYVPIFRVMSWFSFLLQRWPMKCHCWCSVSSGNHGFVIYLYCVSIKLFQLFAVGSPLCWHLSPFDKTRQSCCLLGMTRWSRLILYISYPRPRISHSAKDPGFLLVENYTETTKYLNPESQGFTSIINICTC